MKQLLVTMAAVPVFALVGAAQNPADNMKADLEKMVAQAKVISINGGMMSSPVKGAPYSATEVSETNHVLADGTRIHNESKTSVYRDSEGRVRRETPNQTTIMDPVAGVTYFLNPKTMTATKATLSIPTTFTKRTAGPGMAVGGGVMFRDMVGAGPGAEVSTYEVRSKDGVNTVTVNGKPVDPSQLHDQAFVKIAGEQADIAIVDGMKLKAMKAGEMMAPPPMGTFTFGPGEAGGMVTARSIAPGKTEALGKQALEGVSSDGTRFVSTLDTGAVGNDRPIQITSERWFSSELQTLMMTKHSDPRTGEDIFRLTNVSRSEPGADLFQVPTSYQIIERK